MLRRFADKAVLTHVRHLAKIGFPSKSTLSRPSSRLAFSLTSRNHRRKNLCSKESKYQLQKKIVFWRNVADIRRGDAVALVVRDDLDPVVLHHPDAAVGRSEVDPDHLSPGIGITPLSSKLYSQALSYIYMYMRVPFINLLISNKSNSK